MTKMANHTYMIKPSKFYFQNRNTYNLEIGMHHQGHQSNFMLSLFEKEGHKFIDMVSVTWPRFSPGTSACISALVCLVKTVLLCLLSLLV